MHTTTHPNIVDAELATRVLRWSDNVTDDSADIDSAPRFIVKLTDDLIVFVHIEAADPADRSEDGMSRFTVGRTDTDDHFCTENEDEARHRFVALTRGWRGMLTADHAPTVIAAYDAMIRANFDPANDMDTVKNVAECTDGMFGAWGETIETAEMIGFIVHDEDTDRDGVAGYDALIRAFRAYQQKLIEEVAARTTEQVESVDPIDAHGRPILTVGQLRQIIDNLDDATHVVIDGGGDQYNNVGNVGIPLMPDHDGDWLCLTLFAGTPFDTRQF